MAADILSSFQIVPETTLNVEGNIAAATAPAIVRNDYLVAMGMTRFGVEID
jgi:hypothetical protein